MDLTPFIFLEALLLHPSHKNQGGGEGLLVRVQ